MKQIVLTFFGLSIGFLGLSAQENQEVIPPMAGWNYYGGDEFNGTNIDKSLWGIYGDSKNGYRFDDYGNNKKQGMAQTYRDNMVTVKNGIVSIRATREPIYTGIKYKKNTDCSPKMRAPLKPNHDYSPHGWWSGMLSSRDAQNGGKYYPLYSRIEIKAKIPFSFGTWMALWLRHYNGASTFEIDLEEFFVNDDKKAYGNGRYLHQSVHGMDYNRNWQENSDGTKKPGSGYNYNAKEDRIRGIMFDPSEDFHVYGAQIDSEPGDSTNLVVSFLLDGRVRSVFRTKDYKSNNPKYPYRYNALLTEKYFKYGKDRIWDVAITGGIGGAPYGTNGGGVLYPEMDPLYGGDINKVPKNYVMDIDWLRVYKRASELLWIGSLPNNRRNSAEAINLELPKEKFANLNTGDQLVMDFELSDSAKNIALDFFDNKGNVISTLKPELSKNDAQATFIVSEDFCQKLRSEGCILKGQNIRLYTVCRSTKESCIWNGFKEIQSSEAIIPAQQFNNIEYGQKIEFVVRDVKPNAKIYLHQITNGKELKEQEKSSSENPYEHSLNLKATNDEKTYTIELNQQAINELKKNGLAVTGNDFYLRSVRIVGKKVSTGIENATERLNKTNPDIYSISGVKMADGKEKLSPGVYIIDGKKVIVQ